MVVVYMVVYIVVVVYMVVTMVVYIVAFTAPSSALVTTFLTDRQVDTSLHSFINAVEQNMHLWQLGSIMMCERVCVCFCVSV